MLRAGIHRQDVEPISVGVIVVVVDDEPPTRTFGQCMQLDILFDRLPDTVWATNPK